jgi:hypothetical protein
MIDLPPVIQIAFQEELWSSVSPQALKQRITADGLLAELQRQGTWSLEEYEYVDATKLLSSGRVPTADFTVTPSGTLNPPKQYKRNWIPFSSN